MFARVRKALLIVRFMFAFFRKIAAYTSSFVPADSLLNILPRSYRYFLSHACERTRPKWHALLFNFSQQTHVSTAPLLLSFIASIMALQPFVGPGRCFSFLFLYSVDRTSWTGHKAVARPVPTHRTAKAQTSTRGVGIEHTAPVFELDKTARPLHYTCTDIRVYKDHFPVSSSLHYTCTDIRVYKDHFPVSSSLHYTCTDILVHKVHFPVSSFLHYTCTDILVHKVHLYWHTCL
jgi:hypothetical protein